MYKNIKRKKYNHGEVKNQIHLERYTWPEKQMDQKVYKMFTGYKNKTWDTPKMRDHDRGSVGKGSVDSKAEPDLSS